MGLPWYFFGEEEGRCDTVQLYQVSVSRLCLFCSEATIRHHFFLTLSQCVGTKWGSVAVLTSRIQKSRGLELD